MDISAQDEADHAIAAEGSSWSPKICDPIMIVSHDDKIQTTLPSEIQGRLLASNNNVSIVIFEGQLFLAWRTARIHWPTDSAKMICVSSEYRADVPLSVALSGPWQMEFEVSLGVDVREPDFYEMNGTLYFTFFKGGSRTFSDRPLRMCRRGLGSWSEADEWAGEAEIIWQYARRPGDSRLFASAYSVGFLQNQCCLERCLPAARVKLYCTGDGVSWTLAEGSTRSDASYPSEVQERNGAGELGIAFDLNGDLWGVGRNEFGDESGWGSKLLHSAAETPSLFEHVQASSDPRVFQSCRLFRFGGDIYMISRNDPDGPYWWGQSLLCCLPRCIRFLAYHISRSFRRTETILSRIERNGSSPRVEILLRLPGWGDTAFPSILRVSKTRFLVANYSSPLEPRCRKWSWIRGQFSGEGSQIHMYYLEFDRDSSPRIYGETSPLSGAV